MSLPTQSRWSSLRRGLILLMGLIGGTSIYSLGLGRPGDFGAGLVGLVLGGTAGLAVFFVGSNTFSRRRPHNAVSGEATRSSQATPETTPAPTTAGTVSSR